MTPIQHEHNAALGTPLANVVSRLDHPRLTRSGWTARCPAHPDRSPSLSLAEGRDGRVLLACWAGCSVQDVVRALGLELKDLFPRDHRRPFTPRPRRAKVAVPRSVAEILVETSEFGFTWVAAQQLARVEPQQMHLDVTDCWDYLAEQADIRSVLELAHLIRGVALFRYCTSRSVEDPAAVSRAVTRLLGEAGDAA